MVLQKVLQTPIRPDAREVLDTSALLEISEYRVFQLAYRRWHGHDATNRALERIYIRYIFYEEVPLWVRHFTRHVLQLADEGRLDRVELGLAPPPPPRVSLAQGKRYLIIAVAVCGFIVYLAQGTAHEAAQQPPHSLSAIGSGSGDCSDRARIAGRSGACGPFAVGRG